MNNRFESLNSGLHSGFTVAILSCSLVTNALCAERGGPPHGAAAPRAPMVDRTSHGSVRHAETQVVQRPVEAPHEQFRREPVRPVEPHRDVVPPRDVRVHRDVDVDMHRPHGWDDFAAGRRFGALPHGYLSFNIGAVPYYYSDGLYYQDINGGYQEVYPPVGAIIPQPPDGALQVFAGNQVYYYAGGAFYVWQPDGTYAIAPTPIGVLVPELPPGAVQVAANGTVAYQFNGVYYEPVFVNGVTQYETFMPQ